MENENIERDIILVNYCAVGEIDREMKEKLNIEVEFRVNELVVTKYSSTEGNILNPRDGAMLCLEVMEIRTETCYAGTQVFYVCRSIHGHTVTEYVDGERKVTYNDFQRGMNSRGEYNSYREDELKPASSEVVELITSKN